MNLVFASGVLIPQMLAGQEYFRAVKAKYPDALFPRVPVLGGIPQRAQKLAGSIEQKFPAGLVHIIAHSMGGLDSRYLLSKDLNGLARRVASLSTLCTPHLGTPIADFIVAPRPDISNFAEHVLYETITEAMRVLGWPAGAAGDLTTVSARRFNEQNPDRPGVRYFAYAGVGLESFGLKTAARISGDGRAHTGGSSKRRHSEPGLRNTPRPG
ncbi:MAG: esterase/lipase family protein [Bryobacteraceae bacterium]